MKYDYFERDGAARLYRIPQGQQEPVEFVCGGVWLSSGTFVSKRYLRAEGLTSQVNAARAREISDGAPIDNEPEGHRFFWWENGTNNPPFLFRVDLDFTVYNYVEPEHRDIPRFRRAVLDSNGWALSEHTLAFVLKGGYENTIKEITEAEARQRRPEAFGITDVEAEVEPVAPVPVATITVRGKPQVSLKYNPDTDESTFTLTPNP